MNQEQHFSIIRRTTLVNAAVNTLLAIAKIIIGWIGLSHALLADGIHSLTDVISDGFVYMAAKIGAQSPDDDHPYGHRRVETLAAIIVAILLLLAGVYIVFDAVHHYLAHTITPQPEFYVIITAFFSIIINELLYRYGKHYADKIHSALLLTNAWHNRSDALVSVVVVVTVGATLLGIHHLDVIGAAMIGIMIIYAGGKMIYQCFRELIDTGVDIDTVELIKKSIKEVSGVVTLHQLRTRLHGGAIHADVHIQVDPRISVSEGHYIGEQVHLKLINTVSNLHDVTVHIDPEDDETNQPCAHLPSRDSVETQLAAAWQQLPQFANITQIILHYHDGKLSLSVYFSRHGITNDITQQYRQVAKQAFDCIDRVNFYQQL